MAIEDYIVVLRHDESVEGFGIVYSKEVGKYTVVIEITGKCTSSISVTHDQATIALKTAHAMLEGARPSNAEVK